MELTLLISGQFNPYPQIVHRQWLRILKASFASGFGAVVPLEGSSNDDEQTRLTKTFLLLGSIDLVMQLLLTVATLTTGQTEDDQ